MRRKLIKVGIIDDHHVFREGIRVILEDKSPIKVVWETANGEHFFEVLSDLEMDILLLDIEMPEINGIEIMERIAREFPALKVLVFTFHTKPEYIKCMMKKGAQGYLTKSCNKNELTRAIETVYYGGTFLGSEASQILFQSQKGLADFTYHLPLTRREIEVLKLVAKGLTNKEIGQRLFISHRTVDTHRRNIMTKLDLHNAVALTRYASQQGLITDD